MANTKISALTSATTPLAGTEVLPIVQSSVTKKVSVADLTAGRSVGATSFVSAAGTAAAPSITTSGDTNTGVFFPAADNVAFTTAGVSRGQFDSSGNFLFNTTTDFIGVTSTCLLFKDAGAALRIKRGTDDGGLVVFYNSATVGSGSISVSGSTTAYNTSSDYRLKENIAPMTNALNKLSQLKPVTYVWKQTQASGQGFIAHELQQVVPECVYGDKDAIDAEGKPVYQGIDTSFLAAILTASIQELQNIVAAQEKRIAMLEQNTAEKG